jgi:hypothetical protein
MMRCKYKYQTSPLDQLAAIPRAGSSSRASDLLRLTFLQSRRFMKSCLGGLFRSEAEVGSIDG